MASLKPPGGRLSPIGPLSRSYPLLCLLLLLLAALSLSSCGDQSEQAAGAANTQAGGEQPAASPDPGPEAAESPAMAEEQPAYAYEAPAGAGYGYEEEYGEAPAAAGEPRENGGGMAGAVDMPGFPAAANGDGEAEAAPSAGFDEYQVVLAADAQMKRPGPPGELRVWIGDPEFEPELPEDMATAERSLPAVGESATVEPFAPAFVIEPAQTQCVRIHPTGSEVRFKLTPRDSGTFEVGASVFLYDSPDCSGAPIPKTARSLQVTVQVDRRQALLQRLKQLGEILWDKFLDFWGALLALIFGLILFLIRKKLKKWFGFEEKQD